MLLPPISGRVRCSCFVCASYSSKGRYAYMCMFIFTCMCARLQFSVYLRSGRSQHHCSSGGGKAVIGKFPIVNKVMETKLLWLGRASLASLFVVGLKLLARTTWRWNVSSPFLSFALRFKDNVAKHETLDIHVMELYIKNQSANLGRVLIAHTHTYT